MKNEIGVFCDSKFVILDLEFLRTLDAENICSGLCRDAEAWFDFGTRKDVGGVRWLRLGSSRLAAVVATHGGR